MLKKIIAISTILFLLLGGALISAEEEVIVATITPRNLNLALSSSAISWGLMNLNESKTTMDLNDTKILSNSGTLELELALKTSDSLPSDWQLGEAGENTFGYEFSFNGGTTFIAFNADNSYCIPGVSLLPTESIGFDLKILTPLSLTNGMLEQTITTTILATAI